MVSGPSKGGSTAVACLRDDRLRAVLPLIVAGLQTHLGAARLHRACGKLAAADAVASPAPRSHGRLQANHRVKCSAETLSSIQNAIVA